MTELIESLRRGEQLELDFEQIETLIAWLSGTFRQEPEQQTRSGYDAILVLLVLQQLERSLFKNGHLDIEAAGLGPKQPMDLRRMRFRRLASVFHPDRFPDLADWLTVRSQAIHLAYTRFKQDPDASPEHERPGHTTAPAEAASPTAPSRQAHHETPMHAWLVRLRARFGHDRRLAHKVIAALALIAALPVANLYLAPAITPQSAPGPSADQSSDLPIETPAANATEATSVKTDTSIDGVPPTTAAVDSADNTSMPSQPVAIKTQPVITDSEPAPSDETIAAEERVFGPSVDERLTALGLHDDGPVTDHLGMDGDVPIWHRRTPQAFHSAAPGKQKADDSFSGETTRTIAVETPIDSRPSTKATFARQPGLSSEAPRPVPVLISAEMPAESGTVNSQTAGTPFTLTVKNHIQPDNHTTAAVRSEGELVLGPIKHHAVGHLLAEYQSHVQSGDLNALMRLFTSVNPRQDQRKGITAIADYYRTLFRRSSQRTVHLKVLRMQREGDGWQVETALDFSIASDVGEEQIMYGRTHFRIQPDRGVLKIVAMEN